MTNGTVQLHEVNSRNDLKKFIRFRYDLYRGNKYWCPPLFIDEMRTLRKDKNPAFEYCEARYWLALRDGEIVGRIAAILNRAANEKWGMRNLRFGWFDLIDDEDVARRLLGAVEDWARKLDLKAVQGPLGFTDLDFEGMLVEGFEELSTFATLYNYAYYPRLLESMGYRKDVDWLEYEITTPTEVPESVARISRFVLSRQKLTLLTPKSAREMKTYARGVFQVLNEAFAGLYGTVPLTERQVKTYTDQYFSFINPDYTKLILDAENKVAAFAVAIPSVTRAAQKSAGRLFPLGWLHLLGALRRHDTLDLYLIAVRPDLQKLGLNSILMAEITRCGIENGVRKGESNPELENNEQVQAMWKHYDVRQHKRRRAYLKNV